MKALAVYQEKRERERDDQSGQESYILLPMEYQSEQC